MLMPTTESMDMVLDTTVWDTDMDTPDTPMLVMATTTARGLLMLSQRLMPMLMPTTESMDMVLDTTVWDTDMDTPDTPMLIMATTTARGLLMLSPRSLPATLVWSEVSTVPTLAS